MTLIIMVCTLKVRDELKRRLDELQASLLLERGEKISQQDIVERLLRFALDHPVQALQRIDEFVPVEDDHAWKALENPVDWGVADASRDIDEHLYGGG